MRWKVIVLRRQRLEYLVEADSSEAAEEQALEDAGKERKEPARTEHTSDCFVQWTDQRD